MSDPEIGTITWHDLSVDNANDLKDFYSRVVGWDTVAVPMANNSYKDFCMNLPGTKETVAGVCHSRGSNAKLPPQWIMYVQVADATSSAGSCVELGGQIIDGPREMDGSVYFFIKDPAGAVFAIYS